MYIYINIYIYIYFYNDVYIVIRCTRDVSGGHFKMTSVEVMDDVIIL